MAETHPPAPLVEATVPSEARTSRKARPATRSRARRVIWVLAGLVAALGLAASIAVFMARGAITDKLANVAARSGLTLHHGDVEVPLAGGIAVADVTLTDPASGAVIARVDRIETDVTLIGAVFGQRRPGAVTLRGADVHLALVDGAVVGLQGLFADTRAGAPSDAGAGPAAALQVALDDATITLDARMMGYQSERITVSGFDGRVARDADDTLSASGTGRLKAGGHETTVTLRADGPKGIQAHFDAGFRLGIAGPGEPLWIGLRGVRRAPDTGVTSLEGLGLRRGADHLSVERLTLADAGGRLLPSVDAVTSIDVVGLTAGRGGASFVAAKARVSIARPADGGRPEPTRVEAEEVGVALPAGLGKAVLGSADVRLDGVWQAWDAGRPLDAVTSVSLRAPALRARLGDGQGLGDVPGMGTLERLMGGGDSTTAVAPQGDDEDAPPTSSGRAAQVRALIERLRTWGLDVTDGVVDVRDAAGEPVIALQDVAIRTRGLDDGNLKITLQAAVLRSAVETGRVDIDVAVTDAGQVAWATGSLSGTDLAHQLSRFSSRVTVQPDAHVDVRFDYVRPTEPGVPHRVTGKAELRQFEFEWWRISDRPIRDLEATILFDAQVFARDHRAIIDMAEIRVGEARFSGSLDVTREPGQRARFVARVEMPRQDCGAAARAIPQALLPRLSTLKLVGTMRFDASLSLDFADPRALELTVDGDVDSCRVMSLSPDIDLGALKRRFVHRPTEPEKGLLTHVRVGRGTSEWIRSQDLPDLVKDAAWVTEDRRYTQHAGIRWDLIERALKMDLENERFVYGGSTITQQLVKNLYLDRGKTIGRKLEEAIIAMQMERVLTKDEILTIYINVIEYGPEIYGVKHAAMFYFNKEVDQLSPLEVAFIMGLKPYPHRGYLQWKDGTLKPWWVRRMKHVLGMMAKRVDTVTPEMMEDAAPYQPAFRRPSEPMAKPRRWHKLTRDERRAAPTDEAEDDDAWQPWGPQDER